MTLNEIITCAASGYPDRCVLQYWDAERQCAVVNADGGDTLAQFIAGELFETFDSEADDSEQLDTAIRKMREAANELQAVVTALELMKCERSE